MISLSPQAFERVSAFVSARLEAPLFASDISGAFSYAIATAWLCAQVEDSRSAYRVIDPHLDETRGALVVPAHPPFPAGPWADALTTLSDASLYRRALEYYDHSRGM